MRNRKVVFLSRTTTPFRAESKKSGRFDVNYRQFKGTLHVVRLKEFKVLHCADNIQAFLSDSSRELNKPNLDIETVNNPCLALKLDIFTRTKFCCIPALLASRLGNESEYFEVQEPYPHTVQGEYTESLAASIKGMEQRIRPSNPLHNDISRGKLPTCGNAGWVSSNRETLKVSDLHTDDDAKKDRVEKKWYIECTLAMNRWNYWTRRRGKMHPRNFR